MVDGHTNWTTMFLQIMFLICSVCNTYGVASAASPSCASDEYRAGQLCCLSCPRGYRVHRDCTATTITLCSKCPDETFKEGLSGQKQCSACTKCVTGQEVKKWCTPTSDTECEIRDGFFCSISADKDTFSEATLSCQPHTICDSGVQIQPGTDSTDSTCIKYVAIVFIIIGCICFIILIVVLGALFYRLLKMERDLTELEKQIDKMETLEQGEGCRALWRQLEEKKKTQKQQSKLYELFPRYYEKMKKQELDRELTEMADRIDKMETPDQMEACNTLLEQLDEKKKTPKQKRKFDELIGRYNKILDTMERYLEIYEVFYKRSLEKTQQQNEKLNVWIDRLLEQIKKRELDRELTEKADLIREMKTVQQEQDGEVYKLIDQLLEKAKKERKKESADGAAGEGTSRYTSTSLNSDSSSTSDPSDSSASSDPFLWPASLETSIPPAPSSETQPAGLETSIPPAPSSETQPAGLETSIPPAPSSETQPAEETTPLMSSESPESTGDQQEHTSRTSTPDVTMDGHDDDQSLDALAYWSGTGQLDIEMGPVRTLPKDRNRIL